jgi:SAM-dependent methyltransferase
MSRLRPSLAAVGGFLAGAAVGTTRARTRTAAAVAETTARIRHDLALARPPTAAQRRRSALLELVARRPLPRVLDPGTPISDLLWARLEDADQESVAAVLTGTEAQLWAASDEVTRRRLTFNFATANGVDDVRERAGLVAAMPPEDVHAMARGPIAAGGDTYLADLVVAALGAAGFDLPSGATLLDFGASSGRVLRVIAAARPDLRCLGCDPNEGAIRWASEHLPGEYFVSPQHPPLAGLEDGVLDACYAISVWSHFAAAPALAWLEEMHRLIVPGGALMMTTHGWDTLAAGLRGEWLAGSTAADAAAGLVTEGHFFIDVFGEAGDWGVRDPGWGNAYLTLDWLVAQTGGAWAARLMWPGFLDANQDVVVLERR